MDEFKLVISVSTNIEEKRVVIFKHTISYLFSDYVHLFLLEY